MLQPPQNAVSYIRFSRKHQLPGDSLRRQIETTQRYCAESNLILDESIELRDLGVSAYGGRNVDHGALGVFLGMVRNGEIPHIKALVVEALDRLSRQNPRKTMILLNSILDLGIEIHFTSNRKVFRPDSEVGNNYMEQAIDMIVAITWAASAHGESWHKSERLLKVFATKRTKASQGEGRLANSLPWWLRWKDEKKTVIMAVPARARVVKQIFALTIKGMSSQGIARRLNKSGIETWRPNAKEWSDSRIRDLIRSNAPLGQLSATRKTRLAGRDYSLPGYYPRIVPDDVAQEARAALKNNLTGVRTSDSGRPLNLLKGLLRHEGRWCRHQSHRNGALGPDGKKAWHGYYDDHDPNNEGKKTWSISAVQLEDFLVAGLSEIKPEDLFPPKAPTITRSIAIRAKIADLKQRIANLVNALENGSIAVGQRLAQIEADLVDKENDLRAAEVSEGASRLAGNPGDLNSLMKLDLTEPKVRVKASALLRRLIKRIDVADTLDDLPGVQEMSQSITDRTGTMSSSAIPDPIPPGTKRRRELALLVAFRAGGQRLIIRTSQIFLMSARYDKSIEGSLDAEFQKDLAEWQRLPKAEQHKREKAIKANRARLR